MFERLKIEHPEQVLKMVGEKLPTTDTPLLNELVQHIEKKTTENNALHEENKRQKEENKRLKYTMAVENHFAQSTEEKLKQLEELLEMGMNYDEIKQFHKERDELASLTDGEVD